MQTSKNTTRITCGFLFWIKKRPTKNAAEDDDDNQQIPRLDSDIYVILIEIHTHLECFVFWLGILVVIIENHDTGTLWFLFWIKNAAEDDDDN